MKERFRINHIVLWLPLTFLFGITALNYFNEAAFSAVMNNSFTWVGENVAWFFQLISFSSVILLFAVALSGAGNTRFGGPQAKPEYGNWTWFSIIAVRLRGNKKVQNLGYSCYEEIAKTHDTKGDFGLGSS